VAPLVHRTPLLSSRQLGERIGATAFLKAENLQRTGSFKIRGAFNKLATLSDRERRAGVVAASAGNHGQAVAWAARELGAKATIFMPQDAPMAKVEPTKSYGADAQLTGATFEDALAAALAFVESSRATFVHPYEDERVIAGQGTIGLEIAEQVPDVSTVVIPVGGGGLSSGIALALRAVKPGLRIVGVQAGLDGWTIADGIFVKSVGESTGRILDEVLDDMVAVSDEEICSAIVLLLERAKLVVEGGGAVGVAALLAGRIGRDEGPVAIVLSGGNIDPTLLITVMRHGLTQAGRYLVLRTRVPDRPGELAKLLALLGGARVNVLSVEHHREGMDIPIGETEIELTLVTRDSRHCDEVMETMRGWGYGVERVH